MPTLEAAHYAQINVTLLAEISVLRVACAVKTGGTAAVFLWKAKAVNALLPFNYAGKHVDFVYPLKCH
jgi:hypothetical protein